ncbi:MAG: hypothetical protein ACI8RZ_006265 [Myxococcota bacterium]|jgi:hypothetical protein
MDTWRHQSRSCETQQIAPFTGEGAYHGSTKRRRVAAPKRKPAPPVDEMAPRTLRTYAETNQQAIGSFQAHFPNRYEVLSVLPIPTQEAIRDDGVTFCWCPLELAREQAGPLVRQVLDEMSRHLDGGKQHIYIDAKIQYFAAGDLPVDSQSWHLDGTIVARGEQVQGMGHSLLHDMKARLAGPARPPVCLSYQSSLHCATRFATAPLTIVLPELIENFDVLDRRVHAASPRSEAQPAASIARFDGRSLHRAVVAEDAGWRLWVRCFETDREVRLTSQIIECYGTVFRTR